MLDAIMVKQYALSLMRIVQFLLGVYLGIFAILYTSPEMKRLNASVTSRQLTLTTLVLAVVYFGVTAMSARDVRASSLFGACVALAATALGAFIFIFELFGAGQPDKARAIQHLFAVYFGANALLLLSSIAGFVLSQKLQAVPVKEHGMR